MRRWPSWVWPLALAILWLGGTVVYFLMQQSPVGGLLGVAVTEESGQPLALATVTLQSAQPKAAERIYFTHVTRRDGKFRFRRVPAGLYKLYATSRAHHLGPVLVTVEEGKAREMALELSPDPPFFSLSAPQHTVTPDETPQVFARGFVTSPNLSFRFYRIDSAALWVKAGGALYQLVRSYPGERSERAFIAGNPALTLAGEYTVPITSHDAEGLFQQRMDLTPLRGKPGLYLVAAEADSVRQLEWIAVTTLGLIVKRWGDETLSYVADLKSGQPVSGATVELISAGRTAATGTTDSDGLFSARLPIGTNQQERSFVARAEKGESQAYLRLEIYGEGGEGQQRIYSYTDRPVYRPGNVVNFKGIARSFMDSTYTVKPGEKVQVEARDPHDTLLYRGDLTTDDYGTFSGELRLNDEAATGMYTLASTVGGKSEESYFKVAEYRKPEFTVDVKTDKKRYIRGQEIRATASAQYYFGAPVAGAEVSYLVYRSPHYRYTEYEGDDGGDGEGGGYGGDLILEGKAKTDEKGEAHFTIPTKPGLATRWQEESAQGEAAVEEEVDHDYTIEATITDPSRRSVSANTSTLVTQGEFYVSLRPMSFVAQPGTPTDVEVLAEDYDNRPVKDVRVDIAAGPEIWTRNASRREEEVKTTVTTGSDGKAVFRFTPRRQASYRIDARASDRLGNRLSASAYIWVTGAEFADLQTFYPDVDIVTDKTTYRAGDTAVVLINTKLKGATALVTIEGPRLYEHRLVTLKGNSTRITVPIRPAYAPNFFVAVALVRNKQFASHEKRVRVSVEERQLRVTVKPNKDRYTPGERATYDIGTADWKGRPVPAELSIGVVDESIYAIQEEMAEPMLRFFYPPRENSVTTQYSFAQIYLDANKEPVSIKVRKRFPDTAYWNPKVVTGPDGRGRISFAMPDTLTTWRATVRGITLDTAVGEAVAKVKCSKDLLVRLETPRFMTQNDQLTLSAIAHNYTRADQSASLWLQAPGLDFVGRPKSGEKEQFRLKPDGMRRQDWLVRAPTPGTREVTAFLQAAGGLSDAMALSLPVIPHGRERVEWRSGAVTTTATERLPVRQDSVPGASDLRIRLAPSIASVMLGALDYLAQYPYGCTEQTMSAFLPDVVVARTLRELSIPNPRLEKQLPDMVQAGLSRLYDYEHSDGGWGWWRYDQSDPWMTAYVVFGLITAKQNGFEVNQRFLDEGLDWLARYMEQPPPTGRKFPVAVRERIYPIYVLALAGRGGDVDERLTFLTQNANSLDTYTLAFLTSALIARGRDADARTAARRLWVSGRETQALLSWKGIGGYGEFGGSDTEATAVAFRALYSLYPSDPRLFKVVRWLVLNRQGNHWVSTRDTAFVLYALTDFLKGSKELTPDYQATVTLNGKPVLTRRFTQPDIFAPEVEVKVSGASLPKGSNLLTIGKQGSGNLYYTVILRQYTGGENLTKVVTAADISVDRQYFRMETARNTRTGTIATAPAAHPTTDLRSGQSILVRLTITTPRGYEFVIVEDPLPAGCEVSEQGDVAPYEWDRWWSDITVRDEKVAIFARRLPKGTSVIEYHISPQIPGDYHVMPTEVYSMYNPDLRGSGAETRVRLR